MTDTAPSLQTTRRRPASVTILALIVLMIAVLNLVRFLTAIRQFGLLVKILSISPVYLALTGLVWGVLGVLLFLGLWKGFNWAYRFGRLGIILYVSYFWIDRILVRSSPERWTNLPCLAGITVGFLAGMFWVTSRSGVKTYFGVWNEH